MNHLKLVLCVALLALPSCGTSPGTVSDLRPALPPVVAKAAVLNSPVDLRSALLTLPDDALSELSQGGRNAYLSRPSWGYDPKNRRFWLVCDNPYAGIDSKSMVFLRLFEDESGRTIAASHAARPFADGATPSASFTKVYRLENHAWRDITNSAISSAIPKDAYFRFDDQGPKISFGSYVVQKRSDGLGQFYNFGKGTRSMVWKNGAFHLSDSNSKKANGPKQASVLTQAYQLIAGDESPAINPKFVQVGSGTEELNFDWMVSLSHHP